MCRRTMKKSKSILSLLLTVILIVGLGFTVIAGIGKSKTGAMKNIKLVWILPVVSASLIR